MSTGTTNEKGTKVEDVGEEWEVPRVQATPKKSIEPKSVGVLAILVGDLHLQERPPVGRSAEPDWFAAMARPIKQIRELARKYECPIIAPGDIFDKWNSTPALINWAMGQINGWYSVAGNHDLPLHNYADIKKSAYWTLVQSGHLKHLGFQNTQIDFGDERPKLNIVGFSNGQDHTKWRVPAKNKRNFYLAVVHDYCWFSGHSFPGAEENKHANEHSRVLRNNGFDAAVFGDNHKGFGYTIQGFNLINPGTVMCRNNDEREYVPFIGLLMPSGLIIHKDLNTSLDVWSDEKEEVEETVETAGLIKELLKLGDAAMDFNLSLRQLMKKQGTMTEVKELVHSYLEKTNDR